MKTLLARFRIIAIACCIAPSCHPSASHATEGNDINVYVAGSLSEALQAAILQYRGSQDNNVKLTSGLSADFAKKVENGAPANIFISASKSLVDGLVIKGRIDQDAIASPIGNNLLLIAPADSPLKDITISAKTDFLSMIGPDGTIATGDPDYVILGVYAMQALSRLGKWSAIQPRLARANSVQAALELVENGKAPLGITFSTAAAGSKKVKILGRFPSGTFTPIRYTFAIVKEHDGPKTRKLFDFLTGPAAVRIYAAYGFSAGADDNQ